MAKTTLKSLPPEIQRQIFLLIYTGEAQLQLTPKLIRGRLPQVAEQAIWELCTMRAIDGLAKSAGPEAAPIFYQRNAFTINSLSDFNDFTKTKHHRRLTQGCHAILWITKIHLPRALEWDRYDLKTQENEPHLTPGRLQDGEMEHLLRSMPNVREISLQLRLGDYLIPLDRMELWGGLWGDRAVRTFLHYRALCHQAAAQGAEKRKVDVNVEIVA